MHAVIEILSIRILFHKNVLSFKYNLEKLQHVRNNFEILLFISIYNFISNKPEWSAKVPGGCKPTCFNHLSNLNHYYTTAIDCCIVLRIVIILS